MSNITSSSYPVTTETAESDLIVIVRNGQVMKLTLAGLQEWVEGLIATAQEESNVATTANLISLSSDVNTTGKFAGREVFNTSTSKPVYAVGSAPASVWVDATGTTEHTPV